MHPDREEGGEEINRLNLTVAIKYKDHKEEVKKKGLSVLPGESARARTTPSSTLPWSAKRVQKFTLCEICIWLHHIYLPVVIARPFSAFPACDYATIE
jgi:hypothetical protein